ncbi:DUF317 domain-containing protein [Actinacidiphila guanduensis]|uniref:DUF317 domain-containing protein n=1 Tax=Actinacidiphila guanduensis TaxID=310781 RepID=A0A1H0SHQ6_9ACTN|nr:DUF317 domain-containing protein [Actinacidiphila guanduensis]SDP41069.1 protein of unknown function [Actinacidiphila guanduensis]
MPHTPFDPWAGYLVSPRYLAGSDGTGDAGFAPVAHWPHHHFEDGPCQLLVTSPDGRIRIGWFGDDYELWKITASPDAVSAPRWTATFNHVTPAEIVAGLTSALANGYAQAEATRSEGRFLAHRSMYWGDDIQPLTEAGWTREAAERGTVEIVAPDGQAGAFIDNSRYRSDDEAVTLWAGPPGWGTRAEAIFSSRTPSHLIAATAAAMTDPTPVIREGHTINRSMEHLITLTPLHPPAPAAPRTPTPLDVRRTAVTQALQRATRNPQTAADLRVRAARSRTGIPTSPTDNSQHTSRVSPPATLQSPAHRR